MRRPVHHAWKVAAVIFVVLLAAAGVRATPSVLIVPLEQEFGWNRALISSAVSVNLVLYGLVGPFAGVGLNEMSRRREEGMESRWYNTFAVIGSPAIGKILLLGAILVGIFLFWMIVAQLLYIVTLGPHPPVSISQFAHDVLHTSAGWTMIVVGIGLGFLFAVLVLAISVVSFPMLLDRNVPLDVAVRTSMRVATANPGIMAAWGVIIAAALVVGSIPLLVGLVVVMPVLGHATWHLYRHAVGP